MPLKRIPLAALVSLAAVSCGGRSYTGSPVRIDPERISAEPGSTEELLEVSQRTVSEFINCPRLNANESYRIVLDHIENSTGIRGYDERLLYNRLLSQLIQAGGERFVFLDRASVARERAAQAIGEVEATEGSGQRLKGADLVMTIQLLSLRGAGSVTIQYNVRLTRLDGTIVCSFTHDVKKAA